MIGAWILARSYSFALAQNGKALVRSESDGSRIVSEIGLKIKLLFFGVGSHGEGGRLKSAYRHLIAAVNPAGLQWLEKTVAGAVDCGQTVHGFVIGDGVRDPREEVAEVVGEGGVGAEGEVASAELELNIGVGAMSSSRRGQKRRLCWKMMRLCSSRRKV